MYISNGIAYAREPVQGIQVASAQYVGNHVLLLTFSTGETRLFDASELFNLPVFIPLEDESTLSSFVIDHGVLTWLYGELDIAPEALYERSYKYDRIALAFSDELMC